MAQRWMAQRWIGLGAMALALPGFTLAPRQAWGGESPLPRYHITVTSPLDGPAQADEALTLREALELANGTLSWDRLSPTEQALVEPLPDHQGSDMLGSEIGFALPEGQTTIALTALLPEIVAPGLTLDGTTQAGYDPTLMLDPKFPAPPVITLTAAPNHEVARGFTIAASDVTVRGFTMHGFRTAHRATQTTPPANIFISAQAPAVDSAPNLPLLSALRLTEPEASPKNVVIEQNWLGLTTEGEFPERPSAFGVVVFNGVDTVIRHNRMAYHDGSAVITGYRAEGLQIHQNAIVGNGLAGMPDAIRMEGLIAASEITGNLICGNDGSGVFLFKPDGAIQVYDNQIQYNGRRFERSAVYLMGHDHQVFDNGIGFQPGPGITVAAHPSSQRNLLRGNQFAQLDGLSIDLNAQGNTGVQDFHRGDGPNPTRNSHHRRAETGNGAINAPEFDAYGFAEANGITTVTGTADPNAEIDIYHVREARLPYGPLADWLGTVYANDSGQFAAQLDLPVGSRISAIATAPAYGTSEPAAITTLQAADGSAPVLPSPPLDLPDCSPPLPLPPPVSEEAPPEPLVLEIVRNVHFALDRSDISPESARVLDGIAAALAAYPFLTVELQGHTDPRASVAYNLALSERRALAARDYLLRQCVAPERMRILPMGESQRRSQGDTRLDFARDRRVELIFTDLRGLEIIFIDQENDLQLE
jgi:outer membrane protein OmpA-like peptidoglycan-associated protein